MAASGAGTLAFIDDLIGKHQQGRQESVCRCLLSDLKHNWLQRIFNKIYFESQNFGLPVLCAVLYIFESGEDFALSGLCTVQYILKERQRTKEG